MGYIQGLLGLHLLIYILAGVEAIHVKPDIEQILAAREIDGFKDIQRGKTHFYTETDGYKTKLSFNEFKRRKRDLGPQNGDLTLHIRTDDDNDDIDLELHSASPLLSDKSSIIFRENGVIRRSHSEVPDCFYTGNVKSEPLNTASVALCEHLEGAFKIGDNTYWIESADHAGDDMSHEIIMGKREDKIQFDAAEESRTDGSKRETIDKKEEKSETGTEADDSSRNKRQVTTLTVESVIFVDEAYVNRLKALGYTTDAQFTEQLLVRLHGMQAEWSKSDVLGYNVVFDVKLIEFWETDPSWYSVSSVLDTTLSSVCSGQNAQGTYANYDHVHLFTGVASSDVSGKAYTGKVCDDSFKCAVSTYTRATEFTIPAHEFGHSMNMSHDNDEGCTSTDNHGIMGSKPTGWSTCSISSLQILLSGTDASCLSTTDIATSSVVTLEQLWPGFIYTDNELCAYKRGPGYQFRYYPISVGECSLYSCIQMDTSAANYGTMVNDLIPPDGRYCEAGKVCWTYASGSSYQCITWAATGLDTSLITSVPGGWSAWGSQTSCSRTCGTGVQYRERTCTNPKPQNSAACVGDAYELTLCNTNACAGDSSDQTTLIQQRAAETCTSLISNGYFSASEYQSTGDRFRSSSFGQCEVTCDTQSGFTKPTFQRFGLMPDGTPCSADTQTFQEQWGLPGTTGASHHCVQGYCVETGCNGIPGQILDRCGVCGGTNSTCTVVDAVYTTAISGDFKIHTIPSGASNIFFYFDYNINSMQNYFIELWGGSTGPYIISYAYNTDVDTRTSPVSYAGTQWYYYLDAQFLWAPGTTNQDVDIYVTDFGAGTNTGINYGYSYGATTTTAGPTTTGDGATTTAAPATTTASAGATTTASPGATTTASPGATTTASAGATTTASPGATTTAQNSSACFLKSSVPLLTLLTVPVTYMFTTPMFFVSILQFPFDIRRKSVP